MPPPNQGLKDEAFLAWEKIYFNVVRRNEEYRSELKKKVMDVVRGHAKKSWFKEARYTSRDVKKALLPLNPGTMLFPRPFTLGGAVKWIFSDSFYKKPSALIIAPETGTYVFYKVKEDLVIAVDERDPFSPVQVRFNGGLAYEASPLMRVAQVNKSSWDSYYESSIYTSIEFLPSGFGCVVILKGICQLGDSLEIGRYTQELPWFSNEKNAEEASAVLSALAEALARKTVRGLKLLAPALGELKPLKAVYGHPKSLLSKYKNVDPYNYYCDVTERPNEYRLSTREPVQVIAD